MEAEHVVTRRFAHAAVVAALCGTEVEFKLM